VYDGKEDQVADESQQLVAAQMDQDTRDAIEAELFSQSVRRGRPKLGPGESGKKKERLQYGPSVPKRFRQQPQAAASTD
jgi:hypothetical protein